jgi:hypothetical protein
MNEQLRQRHHQRSAVFNGLLLFNLVLVILQLWLFVSTLENLIAGRPQIAIPAAIASAICVAVNVWMLVGLQRLDHEPT